MIHFSLSIEFKKDNQALHSHPQFGVSLPNIESYNTIEKRIKLRNILMNYLKMFDQAKVPEPNEFKGFYTVKVVLPFTRLHLFEHEKIFPKDLDDEGGYNSFYFQLFFEIGHFRMETGPSVLNKNLTVLKFVYDNIINQRMVRGILEEVRKIHTDYYIGRSLYNVLGKWMLLSYFIMEPSPTLE